MLTRTRPAPFPVLCLLLAGLLSPAAPTAAQQSAEFDLDFQTITLDGRTFPVYDG